MTEENQSSAVRKHNNKWRVVDIVVAAIIAVASGVIFWGWDIVCTARPRSNSPWATSGASAAR